MMLRVTERFMETTFYADRRRGVSTDTRWNHSLKSSLYNASKYIPVQGNRNKAVDRGRHGNALYISDRFTHEPSQEPCWNTSSPFILWSQTMGVKLYSLPKMISFLSFLGKKREEGGGRERERVQVLFFRRKNINWQCETLKSLFARYS